MSLIERAAERLAQLNPVRAATTERSVAPPARVQTEIRPKPDQGRQSLRVDLDIAAMTAAGMITPGATKSLLAEEFRVIKRPLLDNFAGTSAAPVRNANLIMVTSSLPGEGKSFCAVNLAMSIAMELDRTVLLVDADVARPSLPRMLGLKSDKGLLDLLADKTLNFSDVMLTTNVDKLSILTAGAHQAHATEMLASEAMGRLLDDMAQRYSDRVIIFDAPPLLVTTEARVLAARMGQIVFVVRAEVTPQAAITEALGTIEDCPVKLLLLNQARNVDRVAYGYGYGYGY